MSSRAHSTTTRRQHHQRASAHACPECGADPLIIIFTEPGPDDDTAYWFDCPSCTYTSPLRAVPRDVDETSPIVPLASTQIDEYVAAVDVEPPF